MIIIVPLFILFVLLFTNMYYFNQQYDKIIANATEAGRFSIDFKEDFDYKIYLIIAGHSTFEKEDPYKNIEEAREIVSDLISNTSLIENKHRAEDIMKILGNLEKYSRQIEENKRSAVSMMKTLFYGRITSKLLPRWFILQCWNIHIMRQ